MTQHFEQNKNMVQTADGNIHLLSLNHIDDPKILTDGVNYILIDGYWRERIFTTDSSLKVAKQLPREMFVREVDVDLVEVAKDLYKQPHAVSPEDYDIDWKDKDIQEACKDHYVEGFIEGVRYNAKKGEFTREEMEMAFHEGVKCVLQSEDSGKELFNKFIISISALSLPQSLTIENDVITKINW